MDIERVALAFVEMAHRIVWCNAATVGPSGRPRSRVLHPLWTWDGSTLTGVIATGPTPIKTSHIGAHPYVSLSYWAANHDTCSAECHATWAFDDQTCTEVWDAFVAAPEPVGYDPSIIPVWDAPTSPAFAVLKLEPYRLRVFPGSVLLSGEGDVLTWQN